MLFTVNMISLHAGDNGERDTEGGGNSSRGASAGVNGGGAGGLASPGQYYHGMVPANPYASVHRGHASGGMFVSLFCPRSFRAKT